MITATFDSTMDTFTMLRVNKLLLAFPYHHRVQLFMTSLPVRYILYLFTPNVHANISQLHQKKG